LIRRQLSAIWPAFPSRRSAGSIERRGLWP
jgi:hypothetical protein